MHWYDGTIAEAVHLSKQRNAIFVVFIEGENDLSTEMASTIDEEDVVNRLSNQDHFLAIKLKSGSTNYTHFAQIYQFVPVPSLFFIGRNGTPLEVVCAGVQPSSLATRIDRILEEHLKDKQSVRPSTSGESVKQQTADLIQAESSQQPAPSKIDHPQPETSTEPPKKVQKTNHLEVTKSGKEYDVVCDDDVCVRVARIKTDDAGPSSANVVLHEPKKEIQQSSSADPDLEDKIEKAKDLIEARRREKAAKEKELEIQKEMERRATGQGVTELKKWQAEQEFKQIQEERKREKMENNMARQRILEQIAQDRAERKSRDMPQEAKPSHAQPTVSNPPPPSVGDGEARARIQFKLPDGTSHTAHFPAHGTLRHLHEYVAGNLQLSTSNFSLWTAFPRRELLEPNATLRNLQLTPSAALLVLPRRQPNTVASPSLLASIVAFVTQIFTSVILEPSQSIFAWIRSRLSDPPIRPVDPPSEPIEPPTAIRGGSLRRRGNIHRLGDEKADDDNNTWNGNSTQQM